MSWVITCLTTGRRWEVFDKADADKARESSAVLVEPILEYLGRINEEVASDSIPQSSCAAGLMDS